MRLVVTSRTCCRLVAQTVDSAVATLAPVLVVLDPLRPEPGRLALTLDKPLVSEACVDVPHHRLPALACHVTMTTTGQLQERV